MQAGNEKTRVQMEQLANGRWNIHEVGSEDAMASFDDIEQCVDFACDLERNQQAVVVQSVH